MSCRVCTCVAPCHKHPRKVLSVDKGALYAQDALHSDTPNQSMLCYSCVLTPDEAADLQISVLIIMQVHSFCVQLML